jgi:hypothetical protein
MTDITFAGSSIGYIQSIGEQNELGLMDIPIPLTNSTGRQIYKFGGDTKDFDVMTKYAGTSAGIGSLFKLIDIWTGSGFTGGSLVMPFDRTTSSVCIKGWSWDLKSDEGGQTDAGSNIIVGLRFKFAQGVITDLLI